MPTSNSILLYSVLLALPLPLLAQTQDTVRDGASSAELAVEEVVVTGSRIARGTDYEASVPVTSVDSGDLKLAGAVNPERLLNTLPQFTARGAATSSSTSVQDPTASGVASLSLRGLGPSRTLTMVNGRRWMIYDSSQLSDVNTIPAGLIEKIEVVTGGSSAVYGSDAIAGVVNFILRDDFEGVEISSQFNIDGHGDAPVSDTTLTMGGNFSDDRGNAVVSLNYLNRGEIRQTDRDFGLAILTDGTDANGNLAVVRGGSSFVPNGRYTGLPLTAAVLQANPGYNQSLIDAGLAGLGNSGFIMSDDGSSQRPFVSPQDLYNWADGMYLQIPQERWAITGLASFDFNDYATGYLETSFSYNETVIGLAATFISDTLQVEVDNPYVSAELQNVFSELDMINAPIADGLVDLGINRRVREGGTRRQFDERTAYRALMGLRGDLPTNSDRNFFTDLSYDVYYSFARVQNSQTQEGNISRSKFKEGVLSAANSSAGSSLANGNPLINPFGENISADAIDYISVSTSNLDTTEFTVAAATLSANLFELPAGTVAGVFGTEWRSANNRFQPDELLSSGDIAGFFTGSPGQGEVNVSEIFAEFRAPLLADKGIVQELNLNAAFRSSDYDVDSVGSVFTYLGGLDWLVSDSFAVRAQFQHAIRAPNVGELFGGQTIGTPSAVDPCAQPDAATDTVKRDVCVATGVPIALVGTSAVQTNPQVSVLLGGNPNLEAEESDTFTIGFTVNPEFAEALKVSVDYFDISLTGAIAPLAGGPQNILNLCHNVLQNPNSTTCQALNRNPATGDLVSSGHYVAALSENIGEIETRGVDFQVLYSFDLDFGIFDSSSSMSLSYNGTWTDELTQTPVSELPALKDYCVGTFGNTCGDPTPEYKSTTRLSWANGPMTLSARHRWIGEVTLDQIVLPARLGEAGPSASDFPVSKVSGMHYLDLSFEYQAGDQLDFYGGINNVLDNDPPVMGRAAERFNTWADTYDAIGTEFFVGFTASF